MSRWERYGTRDLSYSAWHRTLDNRLTMIDLDGLEYCYRCRKTLALIETARDVGQPFKSTVVMRNAASVLQVPAYLVFYAPWDGMAERFRVEEIFPCRRFLGVLDSAQWSEVLTQLRRLHAPLCGKVAPP